jgi:hypothetical protein
MTFLPENAFVRVFLLGAVSMLASSCGDPQPAADTGETGSAGTTDTGDGSCIPGEPDCECNNGLCLGGLECVDNICGSPECLPGELGCECNMGLCLGDFECVDGLCTEPGGDGDGDTGDGDGDTGDGDGDTGDGDGDTGDGDGDTGDGDGDGDTGDGDGDGDGDLCGNGNIDLGEGCDDGNVENGDGCNNDCTESGELLWQQTFDVLTDDDWAYGTAVDSADRVFVSGLSRTINGDTDAWYRKVSIDGQLFWNQSFGGQGTDGCYRIGIDPDDNLVIACWYGFGGDTDGMLGKYDQDGDVIWERFVMGSDQAFAVAAGADGSIALTGSYGSSTGFVRLYDTDGGLTWEQTFQYGQFSRSRDAGFTADGNIAVVMEPGHRARAYGPDGSVVWTFVDLACETIGLGIDGNNTVIAGCATNQPTTAWFGRLNEVGVQTWENVWAGPQNNYAFANDIAVDSTGRVVAVGSYYVPNVGMKVTTRKYSPDGQDLLWEQIQQGAKVNGTNEATSVTIDSNDNVIVGGYLEQMNDYDAFVAKYSP